MLHRKAAVTNYVRANGSANGVSKLISYIEQLGCEKVKHNGTVAYRGISHIENSTQKQDLQPIEDTIQDISQMVMQEARAAIRDAIRQQGANMIRSISSGLISKAIPKSIRSNSKSKTTTDDTQLKDMIDRKINELMIARNHISSIAGSSRETLMTQLTELQSKVQINKTVFISDANQLKRSHLGTHKIRCIDCRTYIAVKDSVVRDNGRYYAKEDCKLICYKCSRT